MGILFTALGMIPVYVMLIRAFVYEETGWLLVVPFYFLLTSFLLYTLDKVYPF